MTVQNYLQTRLETASVYQLTDEDKSWLDKNGLEDFIYHKLTSKKFRKWKLDSDSQKRIKDAIRLNVSANKQIQFTFPFGGYKLWRVPTTPEVDWAEFFSIAYYVNYLSPILQVYKPGAAFYFSSDDIIIERMDNIDPKDTNAYFDSFQKLLANFNKYFPSNLKIEIKRVADLYPDKEDFEKDLKTKLEEAKKIYEGIDDITKRKKYIMSELNINWEGAKDLTKWPKVKKRQMIEMGPIMHDAYCNVPRRRAFVRGEDKIVVFSTPIPNAVAIGTTKSSVAKFWTGTGVLAKSDGKYNEHILSPQQIEKLKNVPCQLKKVDPIPLKNFSTISTYNQPLDFSHR